MRSMKSSFGVSVLAGSLVFFLSLSGAWGSIITTPPDIDPMKMVGLTIVWNSSSDHTQGGSVKVGGAALGTMYLTSTIQQMQKYGKYLDSTAKITFNPGDVFDTTTPYGVLNGTSFSRSFGWNMAPPAGYLWKIEQTGTSNSGLMVFDPYMNNFAGMYGTAGSNKYITWDSADTLNGQALDTTCENMLHVVYAVPAQISSSITVDYKISVVDSSGVEPLNLAGTAPLFTPATAEFRFSATPEPTTLVLLTLGGLAMLRKKRKA